MLSCLILPLISYVYISSRNVWLRFSFYLEIIGVTFKQLFSNFPLFIFHPFLWELIHEFRSSFFIEEATVNNQLSSINLFNSDVPQNFALQFLFLMNFFLSHFMTILFFRQCLSLVLPFTLKLNWPYYSKQQMAGKWLLSTWPLIFFESSIGAEKNEL